MTTRFLRYTLLALLAPAASLLGQDSLRVLRVEPTSPASPLAPLVITFDHPVAPHFGNSVDPLSVVRITPSVRTKTFWRDPSTLVVTFDTTWKAGSVYTAVIDPALKSETGLPLAVRAPITVTVPQPRVLVSHAARYGDIADTIAHPVVVFDSSIELSELQGRAWLWLRRGCGRTDSLALRPARSEPVPDSVRVPYRDDSKRRLWPDSLRRLVTFDVPATLPRGCQGELRVYFDPTAPLGVHLAGFAVKPPFAVSNIACTTPECLPGRVRILFNQAVTPDEVRRHVRVNDRPATVVTGTSTEFILADSVLPRRAVSVVVEEGLRSVEGEVLERGAHSAVTGKPLPPSVGYLTGRLLVPKYATTLLRVRHVNTDSVMIVIGRLPDSLHLAALAYREDGYGSTLRWSTDVVDSVYRVVRTTGPLDQDRFIDVPASDIPAAWRNDPLVVVRAAPMEEERKRAPDVGLSRRNGVVPPPATTSLNPRIAVVQRSDIALHALRVLDDVHVWATSLRDATPRTGVQLRLRDVARRLIATAITDSRGRAILSLPANQGVSDNLEVDADDAGDHAALALTSEPRWLGEAPPLVRLNDRRVYGAVYAERGIYRPGERAFISGVVRTYDRAKGYQVPARDSVRFAVRSSSPAYGQDIVWSHTGRLGDFGAVDDSLTLPRTLRLGFYSIEFSLFVAGEWRSIASTSIDVEEYRPSEFAVTLDSVRGPLFTGDTVVFNLAAKYLFGEPMVGASLSVQVYERDASNWDIHVPGMSGWSVGVDRGNTPDIDSRDQDRSATTDDAGKFTLVWPTTALSRPRNVAAVVTTADASRQSIVSTRDVTLHAVDAYVGLRARNGRLVLTTRDSLPIEMKSVRANGALRIGDTISLVVERTRYVDSKVAVDTVLRTTRISAALPETLTFKPTSAGAYRVSARTRDELGRPTASDMWFWVAGPDAVWAQRNPRAITLRLSKTSYVPGDTASVFVDSPVAQRAWVVLRHLGILHEQIVDLDAGTKEVRVPIPADAAPEAEIRVIAVEPLGAAADDSTGVYFRTGTARITVSNAPRALRVAIQPARAEYRPRDVVNVNVKVTGNEGRGVRASVTLWAVDEGVTMLTAYRPPDLLSLLTSREDAVAQQSNLLSTLLTAPPAVREAFINSWFTALGGRAVALRLRGATSFRDQTVRLEETVVSASPAVFEPDLRRLFQTTAVFRTVTTGSDGQAMMSFRLPDNVTTFRLYAVAVDEGVRSGTGDTNIVVTQPLIVRAALPRAVRIGDSLFAGAVITQRAQAQTSVTLSAATNNVAVLGSTKTTGMLDAQHALELRFPMRVERGDSVTFRFSGVTDGTNPLGDAVETTLPVSPPGRARAWVASGLVTGSTLATLAIPQGTDTLRSHVTLQLGASVLPLVQSLSNALRRYPYGCTEQVVSAGRGIIARFNLLRSLGDSTSLTSDDRARLEDAVATLVKRQRNDGGIGYWASETWTSPWLTSYAVQFLIGAREIGVNVPQGLLDQAKRYLRTSLSGVKRPTLTDDKWHALTDSLEFAHDAVAAALALRRADAPDTLLERDLLRARHFLKFEDQLVLAQVAWLRNEPESAREILDGAWHFARLEGRRVTIDDSAVSRAWLFRSVTRPYALLLSTTSLVNPRHPMLGALVESVAQSGRSEKTRWWNTLDESGVAEALTLAARSLNLAAPRTVAVSGPRGAIGERKLAPAHVDSLNLSVPTVSTQVNGAPQVQVRMNTSAATPTYYAMTLFEIPDARPVRADQEGIAVERWYENYTDGTPITEVREGSLVRVRIRITVPTDREFVVIDDPLPAGLEAVDLSLRTSAGLPPFPGAPRMREELDEGPSGQRYLYGSWDAGWWTPWEHKEIRDDRVLYFARQLWKGSYQASYVARATTAGSFVRPPAQAEEMYNPAVRGRSDGGRFTVTRAP